MQLLFLIYSDWPGIIVTQSQDVWNTVRTAACEWAAGLCHPYAERGSERERQARVMMSPSPANKLGLTLWGPWRKGKGMEWECAVAMLRDNIHRRWEAVVMLGEGGGQAPWNLCEGEGQRTPSRRHRPRKTNAFKRQCRRDTTLQFSSLTHEEKQLFRPFASCQRDVFSRCKTEPWQWKQVKEERVAQCRNIPLRNISFSFFLFFTLDGKPLKAVPFSSY